MSAEMAARRTAAAAVLADFSRSVDNYLDRGATAPPWQDWAFRGTATLSPADRLMVLGAGART